MRPKTWDNEFSREKNLNQSSLLRNELSKKIMKFRFKLIINIPFTIINIDGYMFSFQEEKKL